LNIITYNKEAAYASANNVDPSYEWVGVIAQDYYAVYGENLADVPKQNVLIDRDPNNPDPETNGIYEERYCLDLGRCNYDPETKQKQL
jgi:hypothetical protein